MTELPTINSKWKHASSGGVYTVLSCAMIEATLQPGVVYEGGHGYAHDGRIWSTWVRPVSEFMDGRFVRVSLVEKEQSK